MIIDFHTHLFPARISAGIIERLSRFGHVAHFTDASEPELAASMRKSGIDYSVNLPVMTRPDQVRSVNDSLIRDREAWMADGVITFGGMHPEFEDYAAEFKRLKAAGIRGVKFHPAYQQTMLSDIRFHRMVGALSELGMISIFHCGQDVGYPELDYAPVRDILKLIEDVRPERLVLAHMGGWQNWDDVERDLAGANVYLDTAYSLGPVYHREGEETQVPYDETISAERFVRICRKHGTDRVLFATDSPWAPQDGYVRFIRKCGLTETEQELILGKNAAGLLGLSGT